MVFGEKSDREIELLRKKIKELESWGRSTVYRLKLLQKMKLFMFLVETVNSYQTNPKCGLLKLNNLVPSWIAWAPSNCQVTSRHLPSNIEAVKDIETNNRLSALAPGAQLVSLLHHGHRIRTEVVVHRAKSTPLSKENINTHNYQDK